MRTRSGFRHHIEFAEHPASTEFEAGALDASVRIQFSATELLEAISYLRETDADRRPLDPIKLSEEGSDDALADVLDQIRAAA